MANTTGKKFGGRKKGSANKATKDARKAIAAFVDDNADRLTGWLDQVANGTDDIPPNPQKAFELFQSVIEYHVPKLQRTEQQMLDENGEKAAFELTINRVVHNATPDSNV